MTAVFQMQEVVFFRKSLEKHVVHPIETLYQKEFLCACADLKAKIPDMPFSSLWASYITCDRLPKKSMLHICGRELLDTWRMFEIDKEKEVEIDYCDSKDGFASFLCGSFISNPVKKHIAILDDLTFKFGINVFSKLEVPSEITLIVMNHMNSMETVEQYAKELGFDYMRILSKQEYANAIEKMFMLRHKKPIVLEVFIDK